MGLVSLESIGIPKALYMILQIMVENFFSPEHHLSDNYSSTELAAIRDELYEFYSDFPRILSPLDEGQAEALFRRLDSERLTIETLERFARKDISRPSYVLNNVNFMGSSLDHLLIQSTGVYHISSRNTVGFMRPDKEYPDGLSLAARMAQAEASIKEALLLDDDLPSVNGNYRKLIFRLNGGAPIHCKGIIEPTSLVGVSTLFFNCRCSLSNYDIESLKEFFELQIPTVDDLEPPIIIQ